MGKDKVVNNEKVYMADVDLNDIETDIETISELICKYSTYEYNPENYEDGDVHGAIKNGEIKPHFPVGVKLEDVIEDLEHLGCLANEFNEGFYCILEEARWEVNQKNCAYNGLYEVQKLVQQELNERCIAVGKMLEEAET